MKKQFVLLWALALILISAPLSKASAQGESVDYSEVKIAGAGFSLGYYSYGSLGSRSMSIPPLNVYYEMGFHEYITAGPFLGFARWGYSYSGYAYNWSIMHVGGRASFHATSFINDIFDGSMDESKLDWYITLMAGLELRRYSGDIFTGSSSNSSRLFLGPVAGVRYYINDNIAVYFEGGRGALGTATFGISTKL